MNYYPTVVQDDLLGPREIIGTQKTGAKRVMFCLQALLLNEAGHHPPQEQKIYLVQAYLMVLFCLTAVVRFPRALDSVD